MRLRQHTGTTIIEFNLTNVAKGMYLIKVNAGDVPDVSKIIVR